MSIRLLRGDFEKGDVVVVDVNDQGLVFEPGTAWEELGEIATENVSEDVATES